LSGRGLDRAAARLTELHGLIDRDPSMANLQKFSDAEERYRLDGGYSAESDARRIVTGLGLKADRVDLGLGVLSGGERRRVELARTAKASFKRVDRLKAQQVSAPKRERKVKVRFPDPPHSGRVSITVKGLAKGYGGPLVFRDVNFEVERRQRLLVMCLNGAGK